MALSLQNDFAVGLLKLSTAAADDLLNTHVSADRSLAILDAMGKELQDAFRHTRSSRQRIRVLRRFVFGKTGFRFDVSDTHGDELSNLLLHMVLANKQGICLTLSLLLLCLAEEVHLPLSGVYVPGHLFVRYSVNDTVINIDPSCGGRHFADSYYAKHYSVPSQSLFCLRELTKEEAFGLYLNSIGVAYAKAGWGNKALNVLQQAVALVKENPEVYHNLGNILKQKGRSTEAKRAYQKALSLHPHYAAAYYQIGNLYRETEHAEEAAQAYAKALDIQPDLLRAQVNLALVYCNSGRTDEAMGLVKKALHLAPRDHDAHVVLALCYEAKGMAKKAIEEYETALSIYPENDELRARLLTLKEHGSTARKGDNGAEITKV